MSFLGSIGMETWHEDGRTLGRVPAAPWVCRPGGGLRIGIAAILADIAMGIPPNGTTQATIELSLRWTSSPPSQGSVTAVATVLKWGRRLMSGECSFVDDSGAVVGWAAATFMTGRIGGGGHEVGSPRHWGGPGEPHVSVEEGLQAELVAPGVVELPLLPRVINGLGGTVQGGIQATLAELAAEQALPGEHQVVDLAIRYLNRVKAGPLRAVARALPGPCPDRAVRVELVDAGDGDRLVSHVLTVVRPLG